MLSIESFSNIADAPLNVADVSLKRLLNRDMMIFVFLVPNMKFHIPEYPKLHFANINTNMHLAPIFTRSSLDFLNFLMLDKVSF